MAVLPAMIQSATQRTEINPALSSHLQFLQDERDAQRDLVVDYRDYTEGTQTARLNNDQLALFPDGKDPEHNVNLCPIIITTIADRLRVTGFDLPDYPDLTEITREWWDAGSMSMVTAGLHVAAGRDGDAYLIVDYDGEKPRWTLNMQDDGTTGVDIAYDEGTRRALYATKRWTMRNPDDPTEYYSRLNVYYHDHVEKYISTGMTAGYVDAGWLPYLGDSEGNEAADPENPHIEYWTANDGTPLGLPVIHFPANSDGDLYGRSDLADIVPALQDQLNDVSVDLRLATKFSGAKVRYIFGVNEQSTTLALHPGALIISADQNVNAGEFTESNLVQLIQAKDSVFRDISTVTGVPLANINPTAQVAAEGTLQQQEAPLIAKVEKRQPVFSSCYEQAIKLALKVQATYGQGVSLSVDEIDDINITIQWKPAVIRNEFVDAQRASLWRDNGVPEEIIWREVLGMSAELVDEAKELKGTDRANRIQENIIQNETARNNALLVAGQIAMNKQQPPQNGNQPPEEMQENA